MKLLTEYLVIIEKNSANALYHLCDSTEGFKKLLETDSSIKLQKNVIVLNGRFESQFEIKAGNIEGKEQRFFNVKFSFDGEEKDIDNYIELLRKIRTIIYDAGGQPETLTNDVSLYFAEKSYPVIHKVENLMRKLITYFMLTNVGKDWVTETSPTPVIQAIEKSKRKQYVDVLHQIDFIHLGDFLFKPYQAKDVKELYEKIDAAESVSDLDLTELKEFKAKSNWERYFSDIVECSDDFLNKKWTQLYDLRCKVAHNAIITKTDFQTIENLVSDVSVYLEKAIDNLDKVNVPKDEKEQLAENVASNINYLYGNFIQLWKEFEIALTERIEGLDNSDTIIRKSTREYLRLLFENDEISSEFLSQAEDLARFRNILLHQQELISEEEIKSKINNLETCKFVIKRNNSWKAEIVNALLFLGAKATLPELYKLIESTTNRKLKDNWQATVRQTLQRYSSDSQIYNGKEDLFQNLGRGYWGLRDPNQKIL
jgi:hypothetical protein